MYAKIFRQIFDSSIADNPKVRFTFMDLLVLADQNGVVDMTHEAIARTTNCPIDWVRESIASLESPDHKSRTPDADGARIKRLDDHRDWGWIILNYDTFREMANEEQRRMKTAARVRKYRENSRKNDDVTPCNADVTPCNAGNAKQKQKQMEKQMQKQKTELPEVIEIYKAYPRQVGRPVAIRAIINALKTMSAPELLEKTKAYALSRVGADHQYTPHPSTWFNQQRFNDHPETWKPHRPAVPTKPEEKSLILKDAEAGLRQVERQFGHLIPPDLKDL